MAKREEMVLHRTGFYIGKTIGETPALKHVGYMSTSRTF